MEVIYLHFLTYRIDNTTAFDMPVVGHWLEQRENRLENVSTKVVWSCDPNTSSEHSTKLCQYLETFSKQNMAFNKQNVAFNKQNMAFIQD